MTRRCNLWPLCACYTQLSRYGKELQDETKIWPMDELAIAEMMIFVNLACVAKYCPDKRIRAFARNHLSQPFWDRQRAMGIQ
jgi:hypothetical protein